MGISHSTTFDTVNIMYNTWRVQVISVAARSKAWLCGRSIAGTAGSDPAQGMDVSCGCCVLSGRGLVKRSPTEWDVSNYVIAKPRYWCFMEGGGGGTWGVKIGRDNWTCWYVLSPKRKETSYSDQTRDLFSIFPTKLNTLLSLLLWLLQATQTNLEGCPSKHVSAAAVTSASNKKWRPFICFFSPRNRW